jgi:hypothetical protein
MPKSKPERKKPQTASEAHAKAPPATATAAPLDADRVALEELRPHMAALPEDALLHTRVDIAAAASATLARALDLGHNELGARLAALPVREFDMSCVRRTEQASRACLELLSRVRTSKAQASEARIDAALAAEATEVRSRMMRVLGHYFDPHPVHGLEIADIRLGSGYADMAQDLKRVSALYLLPDVAAVVKLDPVFFRATDAARARQLAQSINEQLEAARTTAERQAALDLARAWTLLGAAWDQVRRGITFLAWSDPATLANYPPLYSLGRSAYGTARPAPATPELPDAPPAPASPSGTRPPTG